MSKKKQQGGNGKKRRQYGAIPVRISKDGKPQVLPLTSRGKGRWGIPKGWPMSERSPKEAGRREAIEEAGLKGRVIHARPIGRYRYNKSFGSRSNVITVKVFVMEVKRQLRKWPEKPQRKTKWFKPGDAAQRVGDRRLGGMLRRAAKLAATRL